MDLEGEPSSPNSLKPLSVNEHQIVDECGGCQQKQPLSDIPGRNPGLLNIVVNCPERGNILYILITWSQTYKKEESRGITCARRRRSVGRSYGGEVNSKGDRSNSRVTHCLSEP